MARDPRQRRSVERAPAARERDAGSTPPAALPERGPGGAGAEGDGRAHLLEPLLAPASPRERLARLLDGDPLGLEQRSRRHLAERALLLDPERLFLRAVARVAFAWARRPDGDPAGAWLAAQVERAAADLMDEDRAEERGRAQPGRGEARHAFLAEALGIPAQVARRACVVFNDLPRRVRRAWWATVVERRSLEGCVAEGLGTPRQVRDDLRRALLTLSMLEDPGEDPGQGGGEHDA